LFDFLKPGLGDEPSPLTEFKGEPIKKTPDVKQCKCKDKEDKKKKKKKQPRTACFEYVVRQFTDGTKQFSKVLIACEPKSAYKASKKTPATKARKPKVIPGKFPGLPIVN